MSHCLIMFSVLKTMFPYIFPVVFLVSDERVNLDIPSCLKAESVFYTTDSSFFEALLWYFPFSIFFSFLKNSEIAHLGNHT